MNLIGSISKTLASAFLLLLLTVGVLAAQTVTTTAELAAAIAAANAAPSVPATITLASGTYPLTTSLPNLAADGLKLQGPATGSPAIIDANGLATGVIFNVTADHVAIGLHEAWRLAGLLA